MTLRYQQYHSLLMIRAFLRELIEPGKQWKKKELRKRSLRCLRHFPMQYKNGQPIWSCDQLTQDYGQKD